MSNSNKRFAILFYDTGINLGISNHPNKWHCYKTKYYDNGAQALNDYVFSEGERELISEDDEYALQCRIGESILNHMDEDWVNKNMYNQNIEFAFV